MGCNLIRGELTPEEMEYTSAEQSLNLHKFDAEELDLLFRKYSYGGYLNEKQWGYIVEKLNLGTGRYIPSAPIRQFYNSFKTELGYVRKDLLVLGIIFGKGGPIKKSKLIFQAFDVYNSNTLTKANVIAIFEAIFSIVVEKIHDLTMNNIRDHMISLKLQMYADKLRDRKEKLQKKFIKVLLLEESEYISLEKFQEVFKDPHVYALISSTGFREAVRADKSKKLTKLNDSVEEEHEGGIEEISVSLNENNRKKYGRVSSEEEN